MARATAFERPPSSPSRGRTRRPARRSLEVIEGGPDADITDHAEPGSKAAKALAAMKQAETRLFRQ